MTRSSRRPPRRSNGCARWAGLNHAIAGVELLAELRAIEPGGPGGRSSASSAPALSVDGQLLGLSKVRADARGSLAIVAVVAIVLGFIGGAVWISALRAGDTPHTDLRREDRSPCIERIERTEVIKRTCERDGS